MICNIQSLHYFPHITDPPKGSESRPFPSPQSQLPSPCALPAEPRNVHQIGGSLLLAHGTQPLQGNATHSRQHRSCLGARGGELLGSVSVSVGWTELGVASSPGTRAKTRLVIDRFGRRRSRVSRCKEATTFCRRLLTREQQCFRSRRGRRNLPCHRRCRRHCDGTAFRTARDLQTLPAIALGADLVQKFKDAV